MPSVIRSESSFGAGQIILQSHSTRVEDDGFVQIVMSFACLSSALNRNLALFRMENPPPIPLPEDAAALPLQNGSVYLNELDSTADKGIGYIRTLYIGVSLDQKRRIALSEVNRSFSGTYNFRYRNTVSNTTLSVPATISFDYTAEVLSVKWASLSPDDRGPELKPKILARTNFDSDVNPPGGPGIVSAGGGGNFRESVKTEFDQIPVGRVYRYSKTATAIYS